jgi:heterodisulfide reductase subunit A
MLKMERVRVGVFLSDCGGQITKTLNFTELMNHVEKIEGVVYVKQNEEFCSEAGMQIIKDAIHNNSLNRVVVSVDEPVTCMVKIRDTIQDVGLNPYLVEVVNLKEHCASPHSKEPANATKKAKVMLLAAVEKVKLQEPIETLEFPVRKSTLIIGGGLAGMQTAIDLTDMGFQVTLVERLPVIGGMSACVGRFYPTDDCAPCIASPSCNLSGITNTSRKCIYRSGFSEIPNLTILTKSDVVEVEGVPGDYHVTIEQRLYRTRSTVGYPPLFITDRHLMAAEKLTFGFKGKTERITLNIGTIIVATGFDAFDPTGIKEYNYGVYPDVIDHVELARMLHNFGPTKGALIRPSDQKKAKSIVMIQCVGSRDQRYHAYCSSICCMIGLKHALIIKERFPDVDIKMCYIDIRSWGREHEENYYEKAREAGVKFVKGRPTEVMRDPSTGSLIVNVEDALLGEFLGLEADLVVLSTAFEPAQGTPELAEILGLELDDDGFFKEYNAKLRPTETKLRGIYICGAATFPKDAPTTSLHASSAALKAAKFMTAGKYVKDATTAMINSDLCGDCEFCPVMCPYSAIHLEERNDHVVATVEDSQCEGCGICVGTCPLNAIELRHLTESQIVVQIKALVSDGENDRKVLAFCCSECGGTVLDSVGIAGLDYPSNVRVIKVPCTGILKVHHFLSAFQAGADAVMVVGCKEDGCHYETGSKKAKMKVDFSKRLLRLYGIEPERLEMFFNVYTEGTDFVEEANAMTQLVDKLGPFPREII